MEGCRETEVGSMVHVEKEEVLKDIYEHYTRLPHSDAHMEEQSPFLVSEVRRDQ